MYYLDGFVAWMPGRLRLKRCDSQIVTALANGGYVFSIIGLSVCLSVCGQYYSKRDDDLDEIL